MVPCICNWNQGYIGHVHILYKGSFLGQHLKILLSDLIMLTVIRQSIGSLHDDVTYVWTRLFMISSEASRHTFVWGNCELRCCSTALLVPFIVHVYQIIRTESS